MENIEFYNPFWFLSLIQCMKCILFVNNNIFCPFFIGNVPMCTTYCFSSSFWFNNERDKEFLYFISSPDQQGSGKATAGVFTYFFWVLLQPFRANPEYRDVADLPYNSTCLENIKDQTTDMKSLSKYIVFFYHNNV